MTHRCLVQEKIVHEPVMIVCFQTSTLICTGFLNVLSLDKLVLWMFRRNGWPTGTIINHSKKNVLHHDPVTLLKPNQLCLCQTTCAYLSRTANLEPALETHNCDGGGKMMENDGKWWKMMENLGISMSSGCHFCLSELEKTTAFDPTRIRGCKATPQTHILQHQVTLDRFKATAPFKCLGIGSDGILYGIFVTRYPWKLYGRESYDTMGIEMKFWSRAIYSDIPSGKLT